MIYLIASQGQGEEWKAKNGEPKAKVLSHRRHAQGIHPKVGVDSVLQIGPFFSDVSDRAGIRAQLVRGGWPEHLIEWQPTVPADPGGLEGETKLSVVPDITSEQPTWKVYRNRGLIFHATATNLLPPGVVVFLDASQIIEKFTALKEVTRSGTFKIKAFDTAAFEAMFGGVLKQKIDDEVKKLLGKTKLPESSITTGELIKSIDASKWGAKTDLKKVYDLTHTPLYSAKVKFPKKKEEPGGGKDRPA